MWDVPAECKSRLNQLLDRVFGFWLAAPGPMGKSLEASVGPVKMLANEIKAFVLRSTLSP